MTGLELGDPGVEPALFATPDGPRVLSYDRSTRSLVATAQDGETAVIDGASVAAVRDVGRGVALAAPRAPEDPVDLLYQDRVSRELIYGRLDPAGSQLDRRVVLPLGGEAGRFQCLVRAATPAGPRLMGWAFVTHAADRLVSRLVRMTARVAAPETADDWTITPVLETPLVRRSERPCAGACSLVETCVGDGALERCGAVAAVPPPACAACDARSVCASFRTTDGAVEDAAAACRERVEPSDIGPDGRSRRGDADGPLPTGEGLFVQCVAWDDAPGGPQVVVAWHDADRGAVVIASVDASTGVEIGRSRLETHPGEMPGRPLDVLVKGAGIVLAFAEPATGALYVADATKAAGPWTTGYVEQGGAFARLIAYDAGARVTVMHGDPRTATLRLASRDQDGCWAKTAIASATAVHASALVTEAGIWAAWRELAFVDVGQAAHQLVLTRVIAPSCP